VSDAADRRSLTHLNITQDWRFTCDIPSTNRATRAATTLIIVVDLDKSIFGLEIR
jgi:hypothetical protein